LVSSRREGDALVLEHELPGIRIETTVHAVPGLERVELTARGEELELSPITPASAPVVLGEDLRDLGAAIAVRLIRAQGGSVALEGETLRIRLA